MPAQVMPRPSAPRANKIDWERAAPWVTGAVLTLVAIVGVFRHGGDLEVYWRAARRFLAGAPLYPAADGLRTFRYAPGAAILFGPLAPLPLWLARALWYGVMVVVSVAVIRALASRRAPVSYGGVVVLVAALGVARPFLDEFHYAQANVAVLGLMVGAFVAEDRGRGALAGLLVALAIGLKLAPLLFVADWALRRRWRSLAGCAVGLGLLALAPLVTYGPAGTLRNHAAWFGSLATAAPGLLVHGGNQSVFAMAARLGLPTWVAVLAAAGLVAWALGSPFPEPRRSLLLLCFGLAAPLGWFWNFVCALPAMCLLLASRRHLAWPVALFGLSSLVPLYDVGGPRLEHWVFEHSIPGLSMGALFVLTARAARRAIATSPPLTSSPA